MTLSTSQIFFSLATTYYFFFSSEYLHHTPKQFYEGFTFCFFHCNYKPFGLKILTVCFYR